MRDRTAVDANACPSASSKHVLTALRVCHTTTSKPKHAFRMASTWDAHGCMLHITQNFIGLTRWNSIALVDSCSRA
eukprot:5559707-Amphidinium_carterae.1